MLVLPPLPWTITNSLWITNKCVTDNSKQQCNFGHKFSTLPRKRTGSLANLYNLPTTLHFSAANLEGRLSVSLTFFSPVGLSRLSPGIPFTIFISCNQLLYQRGQRLLSPPSYTYTTKWQHSSSPEWSPKFQPVVQGNATGLEFHFLSCKGTDLWNYYTLERI